MICERSTLLRPEVRALQFWVKGFGRLSIGFKSWGVGFRIQGLGFSVYRVFFGLRFVFVCWVLAFSFL